MNEIPNWMEKYIPAMMEQWFGSRQDAVLTKQDLITYREGLSDASYSFPSKHTFDINMNIKIGLLEILNRDFKMDLN